MEGFYQERGVFQFTFIKYEEAKEGHIEYLVKVNTLDGRFFHIRDRYSNMLEFKT